MDLKKLLTVADISCLLVDCCGYMTVTQILVFIFC